MWFTLLSMIVRAQKAAAHLEIQKAMQANSWSDAILPPETPRDRKEAMLTCTQESNRKVNIEICNWDREELNQRVLYIISML